MEEILTLTWDLNVETVCKKVHARTAATKQELEVLMAEAQSLAKIKATYRMGFVKESTDDSVVVDCVGVDPVAFSSRVLKVTIGNGHRIFAFVSTCGLELTTWASSKQDPLQRVLADGICECALFSGTDQLINHLKSKYQIGEHSMMNPGSLPDWPLEEQRKLFQFLGTLPNTIGVSLLDSCFMSPNKTVSGIIIPVVDGSKSMINCQLCPRPSCPNRRAEYDPKLWQNYQKS